MGKYSDAMRALKQIPKDKIEDIRNQADTGSHAKVLQMIMDEEGWTYEETIEACTSQGEKRVPKYALYYRLADPGIVMNLTSKKKKLAFAETLPDDEKEIFLAEMDEFNVGKQIRKELKKSITGKR